MEEEIQRTQKTNLHGKPNRIKQRQRFIVKNKEKCPVCVSVYDFFGF